MKSDQAKPHRRRRPWIPYVLAPLALLAVAEIWVQPIHVKWVRSLEQAEELSGGKPIDFLFIGSSQTRAAIRPNSFERTVQEETGEPVVAVNLGQARSTPVFHYLQIRNLYERRPELLEDVVVFVEMWWSLPAYMEWDEAWNLTGVPWLLTPSLRARDLPAFWKTDISLERKLDQAIRIPLQGSKLFTRQRHLRFHYINLVEGRLSNTLSNIGFHSREIIPEVKIDLEEGTGIRTDPEGVQYARQQARQLSAEMFENARPKTDWEGSVLGDLIHLVQSHGGQVAFFEIPLGETLDPLFRMYSPRSEVEDFTRIATDRWNTPLLYPDLEVTDNDFPDLWHLRSSLAPAYSRALARAWLEQQGISPPSAGEPDQGALNR